MIEGDVTTADGSTMRISMTLRRKPDNGDFAAWKAGLIEAFKRQAEAPVVYDSISLSRANGADWWPWQLGAV